jgi:tetratricopeptide (TPR) repeat protein
MNAALQTGRAELATCAAFAVLVSLAGCGTTAPGPSPEPRDEPAPIVASSALTPAAAFEQRQRELALAATRKQQWAEAALAWELLTVLRPDNGEYRDRLSEARARIDVLVAERLPRAAQAAQRGELDAATQQYLGVLALQPGNATAADALRALERERNRKSYLGKFSRNTLTRRSFAEAEMPVTPGAGRPDVEHAALLANDGEYDDAIALLERQLVISRRDDAARRLLASVYQRKAEALLPRDKPGAIAALEKSVRLDPGDLSTAARLRQLKGSVPAAPAARAASASAPARPASAAPSR